MLESILVAYPDNTPEGLFSISVSYGTEMIDNVLTISCLVDDKEKPVPSWLQSRRFILRSLYADGAYTALYNEHENIRHVEMALFIDKVHADIMARDYQ